MQTFKDTTTGQYWQFDDTDDVRLVNGVYQVFDVNGNRILSVPETLEPAELPEQPTLPEPTLEELKSLKLAEINSIFESAADSLTSEYPPGERLTWAIQQQEALAWEADPESPTPYLDGLAASRGITPEDMRQKTLDQTKLFMAASQSLVGTRQKLRDLIYEAESPEDLDLIQWPTETESETEDGT